MNLGIIEIIWLFVLIGSLWLIAFVDILRNEFKGNDKLVWLLVVTLVPFIGPICYFFIGRKQKTGGKNGDRNV